MKHKREWVEAFIVERCVTGWYVVDYDLEGYEQTIAGPLKSRQAAVNKAIELSYPCGFHNRMTDIPA